MILGKFNIRRTLIILGVAVVSFSAGAFMQHKLTLNSVGKTFNWFIPTVDKAIDKPTIENTISNDFDIGKVKNSDSLTIIFDPRNNQKPTNVISKNEPCYPASKLSAKELRRLKRKEKNN